MKTTVMIVDDEEEVRRSLSSVLSTYGYRVTSFGTAAEALVAMVPHRPDIIVMDVRMPGMDGLTALQLVRKLDPAPPVIIITGHGDVPLAVQAMKLGAVDFLEKPVQDEALSASIAAALAGGSQDTAEAPLHQQLRQRFASLTARQQGVAAMVVDGYSSAAIASHLSISIRTVDHHRASILAKMGATSLPQLLKYLLLAIRQAGV